MIARLIVPTTVTSIDKRPALSIEGDVEVARDGWFVVLAGQPRDAYLWGFEEPPFKVGDKARLIIEVAGDRSKT